MDLSLNYTTDSNNIKSQNSEGQIGLLLSYDGKPYDLHVLDGQPITAKIGNDQGYITDINIDTSKMDDDQKYRGQFNIQLSDDTIQQLPPDMYFIEVWVGVKDQNNNPQQLIFPSEGVLPFTLKPNMVNGSKALPMITYENIRKDWDDFQNFVIHNQTRLEKDLSTMDQTTADFNSKVDSGVSGYSKFIDSADNNLTSMASSGASYINGAVDYANNNVSDINSKVDSARATIKNAAGDVFSKVDSDVASAKNSIAGVVTSADADTTGTTSKATSTIDSEAQSVVSNVTSTMNSADNHIDHAADDIRGQVNNIVTSGSNYINNVANNLDDTTNSAVANINGASQHIDSKTNSAVKNINLTVNSADNYASDLANDTNNKLTSADSHVDSTVNSADDHMSNFASGLNVKTSSANDQINTNISSADTHIDNDVSNADDHINDTANSAVKGINDDATSVSNLTTSYSNGLNNSAISAYNSISASAQSAYANINGSDTSASSAISENAQSAYTGINNSVNSAEAAMNSTTDNGVNSLNTVINSASNSFDYVATHANAALAQTVTNQVDANLDKKTNDLQNQINENKNNILSNAINLVPVTSCDFHNWNNVEMFSIYLHKGAKYQVSFHVNRSKTGVFLSVGKNLNQDNQKINYVNPSYRTGENAQYTFVSNVDGETPFAFFEGGDGDGANISNLCITQSDEYIPFEIAERNRKLQKFEDLKKPNISPYTHYDYRGWNDDIFTIPVQKGKTYWISFNNNRSSTSSWIEFDEFGNNAVNNRVPQGKQYIKKFTSNMTGNAHVRFLEYQDGDGFTADNICITQSENYVPFEIAENNKLGVDGNKPNLIKEDTTNSITYNLAPQQQIEFHANLQPGRLYHFSGDINLPGDMIRIYEQNNANELYENTYNGHYSFNFIPDTNYKNIFIGDYWTSSNRTLTVQHLQVTDTSKEIPFEIAQANREAIENASGKDDLQNQITQNKNSISKQDVQFLDNAPSDMNNISDGKYMCYVSYTSPGKNYPSDFSDADWYLFLIIQHSIYFNGIRKYQYIEDLYTHDVFERDFDSNHWDSWKNNAQDVKNQANQAATNALNQANANMEVNRVNLQNTINDFKNNSLHFNGDLNGINIGQYTDIVGFYNLNGGFFDDAPVPNTDHIWGYLINTGNYGASQTQIFILNVDDSNTSLNNSIYYRCGGGHKIAGQSWTKVATNDDINNLQDQITQNKNDILNRPNFAPFLDQPSDTLGFWDIRPRLNLLKGFDYLITYQNGGDLVYGNQAININTNGNANPHLHYLGDSSHNRHWFKLDSDGINSQLSWGFNTSKITSLFTYTLARNLYILPIANTSKIQDQINQNKTNISSTAADTLNQANNYASSAATSAINQANDNMSYNRASLSAVDNGLQSQVSSLSNRPAWDDDKANNLASNTLDQATAYTDGKINNIDNKFDALSQLGSIVVNKKSDNVGEIAMPEKVISYIGDVFLVTFHVDSGQVGSLMSPSGNFGNAPYDAGDTVSVKVQLKPTQFFNNESNGLPGDFTINRGNCDSVTVSNYQIKLIKRFGISCDSNTFTTEVANNESDAQSKSTQNPNTIYIYPDT